MPRAKQPSLQNVLDEVRAFQEQLRGHRLILEDIRSQNRATIDALGPLDQRSSALERRPSS
jgi:hypothetical protein